MEATDITTSMVTALTRYPLRQYCCRYYNHPIN